MSKQDVIEVEGVVTDTFPNATFEVELDNGHKVLAHISGKLRMHYIKILTGDRVNAEISPYDLTRAESPGERSKSDNSKRRSNYESASSVKAICSKCKIIAARAE